MKRKCLIIPVITTSILLGACGATVDLNTPKSSKLSSEYAYYQDSVNSLRSAMGITPEESDEVFIILSSCGVDDKITQVYKNGNGSDTYYTVWYGLKSLDVYLNGSAVSKVLSSGKEIYPNNTIDFDSTEPEATTETTEKSYAADENSLKQLFTDTILTKCDNLSVSFDEINNCYSITYFPVDDFWSETAFIRQCLNDYIKYCREVYLIDGVSSVEFRTSANLMDSKGNAESKEVFHIRMNKDTFQSYNWDNLEYKNIYDSFTSDCDFFWVYPGVLQEVDTSKIYYAH